MKSGFAANTQNIKQTMPTTIRQGFLLAQQLVPVVSGVDFDSEPEVTWPLKTHGTTEIQQGIGNQTARYKITGQHII